jgi:hypothetical protein
MMHIVVGNGLSIPSVVYEWNVGEESPFKTNHDQAQFVTHVQADGDELMHVAIRFMNLPFTVNTTNSVVRWYGDHAKFIAGNL